MSFQGSPSPSAASSDIKNDVLTTSHVVEIADPSARSQSAYDRRLLLKLDFRIIPILYCLLVIMLIDRANIGNVRIEGILEDLHMKGNDYNVAILVYTVPFMLFELPSSLALRSFRPAVWVALIMFGWGICTIGAGLTRSYEGLLACRFLVGCFEAGFAPCAAYLISQYYKRHEFQIRYSLFFSATQVGGAFGGFLAYALAKMGGTGGYSSWRWIFILEGILTLILGVLAFFLVVPLPEDAKFLDPDEKAYLINRLRQDESQAGADADTLPLTFREVMKIASHWKVVLSLIIYFAADINAASINSFQPTILKAIGYTSSQAQVYTIPVYMVAMVCNIALAFVSDRLKIRSPFLLLGAVIGLVGWLLELLAIPHISPKTGLGAPGMRYAGMFCIAIGAFVQIPILVVWLGNNLRGRKARVVGLAVIIGGGQSGNFVVANVFITGQENRGFKAGFATGVGVTCLGIFAALALAAGLWYENKGLDRKRREEESIGEPSDARLVPFRNTL